MKYSFLLLFMLLSLGAGCAVVSPVPADVADEAVPVDEIVEVDTSAQESLDMITYAMSGKVNIIFDAPTGWFVRQVDAGGASIVVIRETKDNDDQTSLSIRQPWFDDDGTRDSYDEWLAKQGLSGSVGQKEIGTLAFDVWPTTKSITVYTAVLNQEAFEYLLIEVSDGHASIATLFLDSITLFPMQTESEGANRIPDWTAEDSR